MICFEFPLVERVRIFLRLETLFERFYFLTGLNESVAHHYALQCLFEIMECASRADLKSDILREIERQKQNFSLLRNNQEVDQNKLKDLLFTLGDIATQLQTSHQKFGSHLRENEWLMLLKQKTGVPGGAGQFDFPSYHFWLHCETDKRHTDLKLWFQPLKPISQAVAELLKILRESTANHALSAKKGQYQQSSLGDSIHMLRVFLSKTLHAIPEVSANKYVTNIRFVHESTVVNKGGQIETDIPFRLEICKF